MEYLAEYLAWFECWKTIRTELSEY